jgi:hypothetical protein
LLGFERAALQYVMLLWLSMLVLIPFDIAIVDTSLATSTAAAAPPYPPVVGTIMRLCQRYLASPGNTREMAAVVLGRLLTRPDMDAALREFLSWGCAALGSSDSQQASFLVPGGGACRFRPCSLLAGVPTTPLLLPFILSAGTALAFATLFKLGQRSALLGPASKVFPHAVDLLGSKLAASNALAR